MKKILKYILFILLLCIIQGASSHEHIFKNVVHQASEHSYGYIEHICECGYAYKDQYVNPFGSDSII